MVRRQAKEPVSLVGDLGAPETLKDRILRAAYSCFEKYGIEKTTVEDIASAASVHRPAIYRFYDGKAGLISEISEIGALKVRTEVRKHIGRFDNFEDILTDGLFIITKIASRNVYFYRTIEQLSSPAGTFDFEQRFHEIHRSWWERPLRRAIDRGEISADLSIDEVVSWITLSIQMLLLKVRNKRIVEKELKPFIRRFVVRPLIASKG